MKNYVLLTYGFETPTPEIMEAWGKWFASIGENLVDTRGPIGAGREITKTGTRDLPMGLDAFTGSLVITAENLDEATKIAQACPIITSIKVYEQMEM